MKFLHGGAIGDLIYHLPVIRALGGGELYMHPTLNYPGYESMAGMMWTALRPLLELQPYLSAVKWVEDPHSLIKDGICMDHFRGALNWSRNLTTMATDWLGMHKIEDNCEPWINVEGETRVAKVLFNRTPRHNFPNFPWKELVEKYQKDAAFIGLRSEYGEFVKEFGYIPFYETPTFIEAARVIKGCQFYIGTGSGLTALVEGLKHRCIVSACPEFSHAIFYDRPGQQHCWDKVVFWEVE